MFTATEEFTNMPLVVLGHSVVVVGALMCDIQMSILVKTSWTLFNSNNFP
jgi:hypothetical protein